MPISKPLLRYTLLQVPGYLLVGVLLYIAWSSSLLGAPTAVVLMIVWVVKDVLLYPFYRSALGDTKPAGAQALVGSVALASTSIQDQGQVVVCGERWQASSSDGKPIPAGTRVRVESASGLRLHVRPLSQQEHNDWRR